MAEQKRILIKAVGDVCLSGVDADPFVFIKRDLRADILFGNLECCLTGREQRVKKKITLKADPTSVVSLKRNGFHIVSLANNHVLDYGPGGLEDTFRALRAAGIEYVGAGSNAEEAGMVVTIERNGVRVAFLASADAAGVSSSGPTISVLGGRAFREKAAAARKEADLVVVSYHGGIELDTLPSPFILRTLRGLIESGADIVFAHHPHVLQPVEFYRGGVIAYSLGNFVFDNSRYGEKRDLASRSMVLGIEVLFQAGGQRPVLRSEMFPVVVEGDRFPHPIEGEGKEVFFSYMKNLTSRLGEIREGGVDARRIESLLSEAPNKPLITLIRYAIHHAGDFTVGEIILAVKLLLKRLLAGKRKGRKRARL